MSTWLKFTLKVPQWLSKYAYDNCKVNCAYVHAWRKFCQINCDKLHLLHWQQIQKKYFWALYGKAMEMVYMHTIVQMCFSAAAPIHTRNFLIFLRNTYQYVLYYYLHNLQTKSVALIKTVWVKCNEFQGGNHCDE